MTTKQSNCSNTMIMSHNAIKRLLLVLLSSLIILSNTADIFAETRSSLLFTLSETKNISITVTYDSEMPDIAFISPRGERFKEGDPEDKIEVRHAEGAVNYLIPNAARGEWYIEYDKLTNNELEVNYAPYAEAIHIESFELSGISENTATVDFEVSHADNLYYKYVIYAVTTNNGEQVTGQKELTHGSAASGKLVTVNAPLSSLSSYGSYRLMLEVYVESSGIEVFDTAVADKTFAYINERTPEQISDFYAEVDLSEESLLLDWTDYSVRYCDEYIVAVYSPDDLQEPMFSTVYERSITATEVNIDSSWDFIRVELSYRDNGLTSTVKRKDIMLDNGIDVSISTPAQTNSAQAVIEYNTEKSIIASVSVSGMTDEVQLSGSGQFSVALDEFTNDLQVSYSPQTNVLFIIRNEIYSDRTAPILLLYENKTAISTPESKYTLVGETEPGCTLTINQKTIPLKEDGTFLHELPLSNGNNEFIVSSTDSAGNTSMQKINIIKGDTSKGTAASGSQSPSMRYLPLIIALTASAVIVMSIFIFTRVYNKHAPNGRLRAALTVLRNVLLIITPVSLEVLAYTIYKRQEASGAINSAEYSKIVEKSVQDAYQAIQEFEKYNKLFAAACYVFGSLLAATLLLSFLLYYYKKYKDKNNKEGI